MHKIRTEDVCEDFSSDKEMFDCSNYLTYSNHYDDLIKLAIGKMKDGTCGIAIEGFVVLKPKMYLLFVDDNIEDKKAKGVNKNVVAISHNEYKDVLLNNKCLRDIWWIGFKVKTIK